MSSATGCSLCRTSKGAIYRGMELSLRKARNERLVLREADGLIAICAPCFEVLRVERPRSKRPAAFLVAGLVLLLLGRWLIAAVALTLGLLGAWLVLQRPGHATLRKRLREQALVFSSVPLSSFEPEDVREILLDRHLPVCYDEEEPPEDHGP